MVDEEKFFQYCSDINEAVWENRISKHDIEEWINNFKPQPSIDIRKLAIDLLMGFIYYNEAESQYLCKHAFSEFKREKILEGLKKGLSIKEAEDIFTHSIKNIQIIGKNGDSSGLFAYFFRQINGLPLESFINSVDEIKQTTQILIMVDDFIGSGDTIIDNDKFFRSKKIFENYPDLKIYYLVLIATESGLIKIKTYDRRCNVIYSELLNQTYKVFSENTAILSDYTSENRNNAKIVCEKIGEFLEGCDCALGYNSTELLIGLHHNIPNNTLPVIWSSNQEWVPIFPRKKKIYK